MALDLAEALVGKGVPFREAHEAVGRLVIAVGTGALNEATAEQLAAAHPLLEQADLPTPADAASRRNSVKEQAESLRVSIETLKPVT